MSWHLARVTGWGFPDLIIDENKDEYFFDDKRCNNDKLYDFIYEKYDITEFIKWVNDNKSKCLSIVKKALPEQNKDKTDLDYNFSQKIEKHLRGDSVEWNQYITYNREFGHCGFFILPVLEYPGLNEYAVEDENSEVDFSEISEEGVTWLPDTKHGKMASIADSTVLFAYWTEIFKDFNKSIQELKPIIYEYWC